MNGDALVLALDIMTAAFKRSIGVNCNLGTFLFLTTTPAGVVNAGGDDDVDGSELIQLNVEMKFFVWEDDDGFDGLNSKTE